MRLNSVAATIAFLLAIPLVACSQEADVAASAPSPMQASTPDAAAAASASAGSGAVSVDPALPAYQRVSGVSGELSSIGSDTLNNLMTFWAEGYSREYPNVNVQIEGKGSSTAPPALAAGTAQLGPMSRKMKATELDEFEKKFGYKPTPIRVAADALAVYVHKDNPIQQLTLAQVDAIFSKTRRCGSDDPLDHWGQVGGTGPYALRPFSVYGRNSASGTYGYFKKVALCKGDYRDSVKEQPGSASVVQSVGEDQFGIGYSGIGYRTSGVKTLDIAKAAGAKYASADAASVYSGKYPLARYLYVYVNKQPNQSLDPLTEQFLRYALSRQGQEDVVKGGYMPITAKTAAQELALF